MKFKKLLYESNLKINNVLRISLARQIANDILQFARNYSNQQLNTNLYFIGTYLCYKHNLEVYFGKTSSGKSSFVFDDIKKTISIAYNWTGLQPIEIHNHLVHEISHFLLVFKDKITKASKKDEELDAFCAEIGSYIYHYLDTRAKEEILKWMHSGGSLNNPNLPAVIRNRQYYLSLLGKNMYHKFLDRLYNLLVNKKYKIL